MHVFSVLGSFLLGKAMTSAAQYATVWFVLQIVFKYGKIEIKNGLFTGKMFYFLHKKCRAKGKTFFQFKPCKKLFFDQNLCIYRKKL